MFMKVISTRRWGEITSDYFTAVTAPCSSAENLMLVSGDVVIWHHCQWQNTVIECCIWVASPIWDQVELLLLKNPLDVFLKEVIQYYPWFTDRTGGPRKWFPLGQGRTGLRRVPFLAGEESRWSSPQPWSSAVTLVSNLPRLRGASKPYTYNYAFSVEILQGLFSVHAEFRSTQEGYKTSVCIFTYIFLHTGNMQHKVQW